MAIGTPTVLTENSPGAAASTGHTTASVSPGNNNLIILTVVSGLSGAASAPSSVVYNGTGLTFTQIDTQASGNGNICVTVYRAMGSSVTAGTISINFGTGQNCLWQVASWTGTDTSGTNGSGAIRQSAKANGTTNPSATLASALGSSTATGGSVCYNSTSVAVTAASPFTELGTQATVGTPSNRRFVEYTLSPSSTTVNSTSPNANQFGTVVYEIQPPQVTALSGSDTLGVAAGESSTTQANNTGSDTLGVAAGETSANKQLNTGADTLGLAAGESGAVAIVTQIAGSGTLGLAAGESGVVAIITQVAGSDTLGIAAGESSTNKQLNVGTDTLGVAAGESGVITFQSQTGADTLGIAAGESSTNKQLNTGADTPTLAAGESSVLDYIVNFPGTGVYPTTRTWPYAVSATPQTGSDTLGIAAGESSTVMNVAAGSDTLGLAAGESSTTQAQNAKTDTLGVAAGESGALSSTSAVADTLGIAAGESGALLATNTGADTLGLAAGESGVVTILALKTGADTLGLAAGEAGVLVILTLKTGADTLGLAAGESGALADTLSKSGADTPTIAAGESSATQTQRTVTDTLGLAAGESGVLADTLSKSGADTLGIAAGESGSQSSSFATVSGSESPTLAINETSLIDYIVNYPSTATYPGTHVWPSADAILKLGSDTLGLSAGESGVKTVVTATVEYWGFLPV